MVKGNLRENFIQNYKKFKVAIVDNYSSDRTVEIDETGMILKFLNKKIFT